MVESFKKKKYFIALIPGNADPIVTDREGPELRSFGSGDRNFGRHLRTGKFDSVVDQVLQDQSEFGAVRKYLCREVLRSDDGVALLNFLFEKLPDDVERSLQVDPDQFGVPPVQFGEEQQVTDPVIHVADPGADITEVFLRFLIELISVTTHQQIGEVADDAHGLLQVVAGEVGEIFEAKIGADIVT